MTTLLILTTVLVLATILTGVTIQFKKNPLNLKLKPTVKANLCSFALLFVGAIITLFSNGVSAATATTTSGSGLGFLSAALATGFSTMATGYAVGSVGASALGAISENEKLLGKTLIILGLAEGIAIYGLIVSIMILGKL